MSNFLELPAIKVVQPLGVFYSVVISAEELQKVTFVARAKYKKTGIFNKVLSPISGTQRGSDEKREKEIAVYINSSESALPNTIILGANINDRGQLANESDRWYVEKVGSGCYNLIIPKKKTLASVIDGQHRLNGCSRSERTNYDLICSVYLDLPAPYHAYLFAPINANQKKVDRSLAYDLYGFSLEDEPRNVWSPEKFGVYLVRKMNLTEGGPLFQKILLGAQQEDESDNGIISLASVVDSIISLISSNTKIDRDEILHFKNENGREHLTYNMSSPPLRKRYIAGDDDFIENVLVNYLQIADNTLLFDQPKRSYIKKTVGYQALFDVLKFYLKKSEGTYDEDEIQLLMDKVREIDFTNLFFTASGLGRGRMKNVILVTSGLKPIDSLHKTKDYEMYIEITS